MDALLGTLLPLVTDGVAKLLKDEIDSLQKQFPGSTPGEAVGKAIANLVSKANISPEIAKIFTPNLASNLNLANFIAEVSDLNGTLVKNVFNNPGVNDLREFAIHMDTAAIQKGLSDEAKHLADTVRTAAFKAEPTATVEGMVRNDKIPLTSPDPAVKQDVINVLSKLKSNFISHASMTAIATKQPDAIKGVAPERLPAVTNELKTIARVQTISPTTKSMEHLMNTGLTTSLAISQIPKARFVAATAHAMTAPVAAQVHANATNKVIRNENILVNLRQTVQGTGLMVIDGQDLADQRILAVQQLTQQQGLDLNIENLFGSMDQCICDDCTTVYGPASYFVDILNFLRNNNLDPLKPNVNTSVAGEADNIQDTVLDKLFRRRPDLGNLELTCENTNTVLPYIDLANEVMESFIVNLDAFAMTQPPQATIEVFNVSTDTTSAELLSQPQNINYNAYRTLSTAVYPFTLPYHLPISQARVFLSFLNVTRSNMVDLFRHKPPIITPFPNSGLTAQSMGDTLKYLQKTALDRQVSAEYLGMVQEEYIIYTKEAFFTKKYFETTENIVPEMSIEDYQRRIGVRDVQSCWGYNDVASMLSTDDDPNSSTGFTGLTFVKKQFLPRSGVAWMDLVQIVQTNFINPYFPKGRAKTIFDELQFSYRFLQTLVDNRQTEKRRRLGKVAEFLIRSSKLISIGQILYNGASTNNGSSNIAGMGKTTGSKGTKNSSQKPGSVSDDEIRHWVFKNFEDMGRLVVLDFNEGPFLGDGNGGKLHGDVFAIPNELPTNPQPTLPPPGLKLSPSNQSIGTLSPDGQITDFAGTVFANVNINGQVLIGSAASGKTLNDLYSQYSFQVRVGNNITGTISGGVLMLQGKSDPVQYELNENMGNGCNIDNVRIQHLDGTNLDVVEWDRMHRFIRLWRKLGWSIMETDRAIMGLSDPSLCPDATAPVTNGTATSNVTKGINSAGAGPGTGTTTSGLINGVTNGTTDIDDILITFDDYTNSASSVVDGNNSGTGSGSGSGAGSGTSKQLPDINPCLIKQLGCVSQIMTFAGLTIEQLLCFWTDIPTVAANSDKSLYQKLFFTSNLKSNDPVFGPDINGDYFTGAPAKITDNMPVIMAAFGIKADDIKYLLKLSPDPYGTPNPSPIDDVLNIHNLSQIYKCSLLSRVLGIQIYDVNHITQGFGDVLNSAAIFWDMLQTWNIMEQINFPWEEVRYIVDEIITPDDPLSPDPTTVLLTAKALNDGIQGIKTTYVPPPDKSDPDLVATDAIVKARLALLVDDNTTSGIMGILDGTTVYKVAAPDVPTIDPTSLTDFQAALASVSNKLTYVPGVDNRSSQLFVKGILTLDEFENAKGLGDDFSNGAAVLVGRIGAKMTKIQVEKAKTIGDQLSAKWVAAVQDAYQQPINPFNYMLKGILDDATVKLEMDPKTRYILAGDFPDNVDNAPADARTPSQKRLYFLQKFIPFLQQKLARILVSDTVISAVGFNDRVLAKTILENVAVSKDKTQITLDYLLQLLNPPPSDNTIGAPSFDGYIVVPNNDSYSFVIPQETTPLPIVVNGQTLLFSRQQVDPETIYATDAVSLKAGKLYQIQLNLNMTLLQWKPATAALGAVPSSSFLPKFAKTEATKVFDRLQKTAILVNHFQLTSDEVIYIHDHSDVFAGMQFNSLSMDQWTRMQSYYQFRTSLPQKTSLSLLDLFNWSANNSQVTVDTPPNAKKETLSGQIAAATLWKEGDVKEVLARVNFTPTGTAADFESEETLVRIGKLITFSQNLAIDIPRLFHWSSPLGTSSKDFFKLQAIAEDIQKVAKAKFDMSSWTDAVRPVNDVLREQQKNALIAYLLVQDEVRLQGVTDADSLFEFFLIDVQMTPLVETSRIKQAISTVQVYIQRCLLGLEASNNVTPASLDKTRWDWMSQYRLWEANRKIFLYPENWIDPTLRDDKSDFFLKLEGQLLQKDLSQDTVTSAVRSFLYSVNEVASMEIVALYVEQQPSGISTTTITTSSTTTTTTTTTTNNTTTTSTTPPTVGPQSFKVITTSTSNAKIHLFARTGVSPYSYYYISYSMGNWTCWSKMDIEIPFFTATNTDGTDGPTGNYMSPIVHNGRLLVFIPQLLKKTVANPVRSGDSFHTLGTRTPAEAAAQNQWELKMSYTELRSGKWIQRQLCPDGVLIANDPNPADVTVSTTTVASPPSPIRPVESLAFVVAEVTGPPPAGAAATNPGVPYGVRILVGKMVSSLNQTDNSQHAQLSPIAAIPPAPPVAGAAQNTTPSSPPPSVVMGIAEWDFVDGKLSFTEIIDPKTLPNLDMGAFGTGVPTSTGTSFHYQQPAKVLRSMQAIDTGTLGSPSPSMPTFLNSSAPFVSNESVNIMSPSGTILTSSSRPFLTREDVTTVTDSTVALPTTTAMQGTYLLYHKFIHPMMASSVGPIAAGDTMPLSPLYSFLSGLSATPPAIGPTPPQSDPTATKIPPLSDLDEAFGGSLISPDLSNQARSFNERRGPYSLYNWEIGLHAPMILIDRLLKSQQFDQALNVCHYVFNPMVPGDQTDISRFWIFAPFRATKTQTVQQMFMQYVANTFRQDVSDWRDNPFQPHVVARSRPQAYMMWVVMKYIEILIAYGDYYFRQGTLETIPEAIQMYILASHIYGPRGQLIQRQTPQKKYTYNELAAKFDAFGNAMVQLEDAFPYSNQTPLPIGKLPNDSSAPLANVFGFSGTLFFAIPDNPNLRALGATIDDRLFKIRHSQDINGITRILPLFEPPIDPGLLVQAAAQGLSLSSVLQDLNGPMPNYRFQYLLQKALDLAMEVKSFGSALVSAREKMDFESLSLLHAQHDTATQTLLMDMKKLAVDEANKSLEALQYSRNAPVSRLQFYLQQVGADLSGVPAVDSEFQELINKIDKPIQDGGLQLSPFEKEEMDNYAQAADLSGGVGIMETIASIASMIPDFSTQIMPLGCGESITYGGNNLGAYYSAIARELNMGVSDISYEAGTAGRKSQSQRALQDRILQANAAGYEISSIDKQATVNKIRIALANKDIDVQQKQIDQMHEIEDFLRQKYSNVELYSWMEGTTQSLFYDTYTQAYDLAKKAEKAFQFERPDYSSTTFIQPGYWDTTRDGLFAGEQLYNALKQLEAKYIEDRGYDFEITKNISLRQLDPMALMILRESGSCTFDIPEVLFDMDFPGHYMRRLRTVSTSVPCIVGPYTSINSTLRLTQSKIRYLTTNPSGTAYDEVTDPNASPDPRFVTYTAPIPAIAVCSGQSDSGTFELNFHDDRYLPFEGAGAISSWSFSLPQHDTYRQFNYESITDVIIQLRYTSIDGGAKLMAGAQGKVARYIGAATYIGTSGGLFALFDLKNEFAASWAKMMTDQAANGATQGATLDLPKLDEKLPVFVPRGTTVQALASDVYLVSDGKFSSDATSPVKLLAGSNEQDLAPEQARVGLKGLSSYSVNIRNGLTVGSWKLQMPSGDTTIAAKRAWLLVRYFLH